VGYSPWRLILATLVRVVALSGAALDQLKLTSAVNLMAGRDYRGPAY
jgi:hypothetical protein